MSIIGLAKKLAMSEIELIEFLKENKVVYCKKEMKINCKSSIEPLSKSHLLTVKFAQD